MTQGDAEPGLGSPWIVRFARALPQRYADAVAGPGWRLFWFKAIIACGLLAGFLLSPKLWLSSRFYPLTPISTLLPPIPSPLDRWWFGTLLVLLVAIALTPRSRWLIGLFVCLAAGLSLWDQSRWQPWFYQYLFLLGAFAFCWTPRRTAGTDQPQAILHTGRFILAATYIWSGLQKFNVSFATDVYPSLLEPFLPEEARKLAMSGGLIVPLVETGVGLGLLVPGLRPIALALVLAMHATLLYCLGPYGHNWNTIVWPWNLALMAMAIVLFCRTRNVSFKAIVWPSTFPYRWLVLLLFGVMPCFNFLGYWDSYLSAALYSGNTIEADLSVSPTVYWRLPEAVRGYCGLPEDRCVVDLMTWSMEELNVPPYPEPRIYRNIARSFCPLAEEPSAVILVIQGRPHWLTDVREETKEDCSAQKRKR